MRNSVLVVGFIIMGMNINIASGSALLDEKDNAQIEEGILKKVSRANSDVSSLTRSEKEWLYETNLLNTLRDLKSHNYSNPEDISNTLSELARFYINRNQEHLAQENYVLKKQSLI